MATEPAKCGTQRVKMHVGGMLSQQSVVFSKAKAGGPQPCGLWGLGCKQGLKIEQL